jgi:Lon protease-like protein
VTETPLFLLNTVLFPGGLLPLRVFEQRYLEMAKSCLREKKPFGVCRIREGAEVGAPATHEDIDCLAQILHWDMQQLGLLQIVAQGERRFRVLERRVQGDGLSLATIEVLPEEADAPPPASFAAGRQLLERIAAEHGERFFAKPYRFDSSAWVGARLAEVLPLAGPVKQQLLELDGPQRLQALQRLIAQA